MRRFAAALAVAALVPLVWAAPAAADYQSTTETVWEAPGPGPSHCLRTRSERSYSDVQGPYWTFTATAEFGSTASGTGCDTGPGNAWPAGWLAARADLMVWDGQAWSVCVEEPWSYSDRDAEAMAQSYGGGYGPCGAGWYGALAYAAAFDGTQWQGYDRSVWSGYEWLDGAPGWTATATPGPV
jgi:hypothetical protein